MSERETAKDSINRGELERAKRRALAIFDKWLRITGAIPEGSSWVWEAESCIEDAVEIGVQAAYGLHQPLESEQDEDESEQPVDAPQPCPHCKLPAVLPETCTPELGAVIDQQLEERWDLLNAGVDIGQRLAQDAPQPCVWRDIATAPKDGTWFLAWHPAYQAWTVASVRGADTWTEGRWNVDVRALNMASACYELSDFTHWMPLPPVPPVQETPIPSGQE